MPCLGLNFGPLFCRSGEGPLTLRVSELAVHNLLRMGHLASAALSAALPDSSTGSVMQQQPQPRGMEDSVSASTVAQPAPIELCNACPLGFLIGQTGTRERLQLPAGSTLAYTWHSAPGLHPSAVRLLRLCTAAAAHLQDQPAATGATQPATDASEQQPWSEPFDAMAASAAVLRTWLPSGGTAVLVAVHVAKVSMVTSEPSTDAVCETDTASACMQLYVSARPCDKREQHLQEAHSWRVKLRPSHVLLSAAGHPLQLCISGPQLHAAEQPGTQALQLAPLPHGSNGPGPAESSPAVMVCHGNAARASTALRAWLGPGNGWSLPVRLASLAEQVLPLFHCSSQCLHASLFSGCPQQLLALHNWRR